jgi:poly-gamma-glutamate synthesis protein (capsule biosynthesis protein)
MAYLEPETYADAPKEAWDAHFFSENTDGFFAGAHMDFNIIVPFSREAEKGLWKRSRLEKVKEYILCQM